MVTPINDRYEDVQGLSLLAIDQYFRDIHWIKENPLTDEEEVRLLQQIARAKADPYNQWRARIAQSARDRLVEAYQPVVLSVASRIFSRFPHSGCVDVLDLVNEGNVAFLRVLSKYDVTGFSCLRPFLIKAAANAMVTALSNYGGSLRLSRHMCHALGEATRVRRDFYDQFQRYPTFTEIASALGLSLSRVVEIEECRCLQCMASLQGLLQEDATQDTLECQRLFASSDDGGDRRERNSQVVHRALDIALPPRQREVVCQHFGIGDGVEQLSEYEIAEKDGVWQSTVARLGKGAIERLREAVEMHMEQGQPVCTFSLDDYYTVNQVAEMLEVHPASLSLWTKKGRLPVARKVRGFGGVKFLYAKDVVHQIMVARSSQKVLKEMAV